MRRNPIPARELRQLPQSGVTLIELLVAVALLAILLAAAVPSFFELQQRSILKGVAEDVVSQLANYRFEAVKRNARVTVAFVGAPTTTAWCVGATQGTVACDCSDSTSVCSVGVFPSPGDDARRGSRLVARSGFSAAGSVTFDPATGVLTAFGDAGSLSFGSPDAGIDYRLRLDVNALGRASLCVPAGARSLTGYQSC